jgi:hypothetical protein
MPKKRTPKYNRRDYEATSDEIVLARCLAVLEAAAHLVGKTIRESFLSASDVIVVLDPTTSENAHHIAVNTRLSTTGISVCLGQRADLAATLGPRVAAPVQADLQRPGREGLVPVLVIAHGGATMLTIPVPLRHEATTAN